MSKLIHNKKIRYVGLTLVELVLVIAILAILASVAIPKINTWIKQAKTKKAAYQVLSDIQYVQSMALAKGESKITFNTNNYIAEVPIGTTLFTKILENGITISATFFSTSNELIFQRNKLPTSNGTIEISGYGVTYKILVNHITGRIRLEKIS
ncbi:N-terminal methylation [Thermodesulfatator indicus DSM 15286]|uniref:N-terminal methylation n=1 Tax=Thermodesulfatator indicus (strain DSM 15286 / JCM 11887 / CIR29812) TaxID=667014 RepID=F8ABJ5_THEID|nr:prepilin-type N-terminal cleavage/methylation domain-containing protein [Thermodesulfatator indicus]AEH45592.1 N-terminal methylation [Thermodesulfatator indicus DSM 15286]